MFAGADQNWPRVRKANCSGVPGEKSCARGIPPDRGSDGLSMAARSASLPIGEVPAGGCLVFEVGGLFTRHERPSLKQSCLILFFWITKRASDYDKNWSRKGVWLSLPSYGGIFLQLSIWELIRSSGPLPKAIMMLLQIGRASCRERV